METEVQITLVFLGAGILAYVIIPGLLGFRTTGEDEKNVVLRCLGPGARLHGRVLRKNKCEVSRDRGEIPCSSLSPPVVVLTPILIIFPDRFSPGS